MSGETVLYDLVRKGSKPTSWSPNPWKARLSLNYKKIPYSTVFLDFNEIAPTLSALGATPNAPKINDKEYSVPTVKLPSGKLVMDSLLIAKELEAQQPSPSLHLDDPHIPQVLETVKTLTYGMMSMMGPLMVENILTEVGVNRFKPLMEAAAQNPVEPEAEWKKIEAVLGTFRSMLAEKPGPFIRGSEVGFADFVLVGLFTMLERAGGEPFQRVMGFDKSFKTLYEACGEWLEKDD